ncbi:DUF1015 domain-containing protein [uncultured Dokdonia sp.]|uniref:DUF1015 domain-containing protein n=1 Tax=uncultured Dokdonia sp. TaxID=575653 RepID=UPI0026026828|nr:DUF1015 domain-containing protein [uncultured Dokdonia sp.]
MPKIIPFRAVRPTRDKVSLVAARSYESYSKKGRKFRMDRNPYSFLHIVNPGYKYHKEITGKKVFALVRNRYQEFKEDEIFIQEEQPAFYIYKIVDRNGKVFCGLIGGASIFDYENNLIKKHEDTLEHREVLFKEYLDTVGFNAEAVLLTYPDNKKITSIISQVTKERAEYEFTSTTRDTHYLWVLSDAKHITAIQEEFAQMPQLYIADGHHRSSSSYLLAKEHQKNDPEYHQEASYNYFMSYFIPESHVQIYEFNRLIKDLNGLSKEEFLIALDTYFRIENRGVAAYNPSKKHHFSMYLDGEFYSLYLRKSNYNFENTLEALDTQILYKTILEPILGISDLRNDARISYAGGKKDMIYVKSAIDKGEYTVGFGMLPLTMDELKTIADDGYTMPPKSTYIEPKLRSGITIYEF